MFYNRKSKRPVHLLMENDAEWDDQITERKLKLVTEDIEAAKKQIQSLKTQTTQLRKEIDNLNFEKNELLSYQNDTDQIEDEGDDEHPEGTFFTLLAQLEAEEASLRGELQSYKDLQRDLGHEKNKYVQMNKKLSAVVETERGRCKEEKNKIRQLKDDLLELNEQLEKQKTHLSELQDTCRDLRDESLEVTEVLKRQGEGILMDLVEKEREKKQLLEKLRKDEKTKKEMVDRERREYEASVAQCNSKIAKQQSISSWLNDRTILSGKLKRSRQQLMLAKQNLIDAKKRESLLSEKFRKMLGEDDPDGTGPGAKRMVQAEIDELRGGRGVQDTSEEIEIEREYGDELREQLDKLERSVKEFEEHRNQTMSDLNEELLDCSQDGYLKLLQSELNGLQATVSRY